MAQGPLSVLDILHKMPRNLEKFLSKFDLDKRIKEEDHIDDFYMHFQIVEVWYDDIACRTFPFTLEGGGTTWYHSLPINSIHGQREFKKLFLEKFSDDKTLTMLLKELKNINMGEKEKFKYFN